MQTSTQYYKFYRQAKYNTTKHATTIPTNQLRSARATTTRKILPCQCSNTTTARCQGFTLVQIEECCIYSTSSVSPYPAGTTVYSSSTKWKQRLSTLHLKKLNTIYFTYYKQKTSRSTGQTPLSTSRAQQHTTTTTRYLSQTTIYANALSSTKVFHHK